MPVVFETNTELTRNINARLVGKTHTGSQRDRVATDEIRPLVHIHADAVAHPMGKIFVIRAIARGADHVTRCSVDGLTLNTRMSRGKRSSLRLMNNVEH